MSAPNCSPGPWRADFTRTPIEILAPNALIHGEPCVVAEVPSSAGYEDATRADASLIAAAPGLFDALSRALEWAGTIVADEGFVPDGLLSAMHDALLKAVST